MQEKLDTWAEHLYGQRAHPGIAGKTPDQAAATWPGAVRRIANERALAIIAEEPVVRRIARDGIRIAGARFFPTNSSVEGYVAHLGETALCFPDPAGDMGCYLLFLETPRGRTFIGTVENAERCGRDRGELALLARQAQDQFIRTGRADLRRIRNRIKPETLADAILDQATTECLAGRAPPVQTLALTRPALEERSDVGERASAFSRAGEGAFHQNAELLDAAATERSSSDDHRPDDPAAAWRRYGELRSTSCLSVENRDWMTHYETTREYRVAVQFQTAPLNAPSRRSRHE